MRPAKLSSRIALSLLLTLGGFAGGCGPADTVIDEPPIVVTPSPAAPTITCPEATHPLLAASIAIRRGAVSVVEGENVKAVHSPDDVFLKVEFATPPRGGYVVDVQSVTAVLHPVVSLKKPDSFLIAATDVRGNVVRWSQVLLQDFDVLAVDRPGK